MARPFELSGPPLDISFEQDELFEQLWSSGQ
jgi:hypothetical protein